LSQGILADEALRVLDQFQMQLATQNKHACSAANKTKWRKREGESELLQSEETFSESQQTHSE
jgi:hypothetical protein